MTPLAHDDPLLLIVDNDLEMRAMLREVLTEGGFRIAEAATSDELVGLAPRVEPAAIILDHHMPGALGLDVLPILRRCCPDVPVVLITAFGGPRTRDTALKLGAAVYPDQPFRLGTLLDAIGDALGRRGAHGTRVRQPSVPGADGPSRPLRGLTILLVEDHAASRHTLAISYALTERGCSVPKTDSGRSRSWPARSRTSWCAICRCPAWTASN